MMGCKEIIRLEDNMGLEEIEKRWEPFLELDTEVYINPSDMKRDIKWLILRIKKLQTTIGYMVKTGLEMKCELDMRKERIAQLEVSDGKLRKRILFLLNRLDAYEDRSYNKDAEVRDDDKTEIT